MIKFYAVIPTIFLWCSTLKFFTFGECEGSTHDGAVWKSRAAGRSQFSFCRVGSGEPGLGGSLLYPPLPPDVPHLCGGVFIVTSASWVGWVGEILTIPFVFPLENFLGLPSLVGYLSCLFIVNPSKATHYDFQYAILLISMCTSDGRLSVGVGPGVSSQGLTMWELDGYGC